jgi:A/G-specific adenine glycosylase
MKKWEPSSRRAPVGFSPLTEVPHPLFNPSRRGMFRRSLLRWYDSQKRDLPWRADHDPYRVWLSEIMLQQTRVGAVVGYYGRFLRRFPTVERLAAARLASVLAEWSGLGYYRRARMLHEAARKIVREHSGVFPRTAEGLRELPGIGRYTSAAIASIAFGQTAAVVDGNVERVLQRVSGKILRDVELWQGAKELLSASRPGDFNQALMELGATVCLPRQPNCDVCPVFKLCTAQGTMKKPRREVRQKRRVSYALDRRKDSVFLVQRSRLSTLMPGMWELPEIPGSNGTARQALTLKHAITVTDYSVRVMRKPTPSGVKGRWVPDSQLARLPLTGLTRKILKAMEII